MKYIYYSIVAFTLFGFIIIIVLMALSDSCNAQVFVSDKYTLGESQPNYFKIIVDKNPIPILVRPKTDNDGSRYLYYNPSNDGYESDLGKITTYEFEACNYGGCSGKTSDIFKETKPDKPVIYYKNE